MTASLAAETLGGPGTVNTSGNAVKHANNTNIDFFRLEITAFISL